MSELNFKTVAEFAEYLKKRCGEECVITQDGCWNEIDNVLIFDGEEYIVALFTSADYSKDFFIRDYLVNEPNPFHEVKEYDYIEADGLENTLQSAIKTFLKILKDNHF